MCIFMCNLYNATVVNCMNLKVSFWNQPRTWKTSFWRNNDTPSILNSSISKQFCTYKIKGRANLTLTNYKKMVKCTWRFAYRISFIWWIWCKATPVFSRIFNWGLRNVLLHQHKNEGGWSRISGEFNRNCQYVIRNGQTEHSPGTLRRSDSKQALCTLN